jgi:hypothetical protein
MAILSTPDGLGSDGAMGLPTVTSAVSIPQRWVILVKFLRLWEISGLPLLPIWGKGVRVIILLEILTFYWSVSVCFTNRSVGLGSGCSSRDPAFIDAEDSGVREGYISTGLMVPSTDTFTVHGVRWIPLEFMPPLIEILHRKSAYEH